MTYDGTDSHLVRKWIADDQVAAFRLCVVGLDGASTPLDTWRKEVGGTEIAEAIEETASRHCNALGGSHAYSLQAIQVDSGAICATHVFRVSAEALPGASVLASEPANVGGITAQLMRHQEAIFSSTVIAWDRLGKNSAAMIERSDRRAARSEAAYMRVVEMHQELIDRSEERKATSQRADRLMDIKADSAKKVLALAPVILDSIVAKVAPEGLDRASAHTARSLFESLKEDQLAGILSKLDPEQQLILMHLFKRLAGEAEGVEVNETDGGAGDAKH